MTKKSTEELQSSVRLAPGLYLIRLIQKRSGGRPIAIRVKKVATGNDGAITFFPGLGVSGNTLRQPGQCLVARVEHGDASLVLDYLVQSADTLNDYSAKIDRVDDSGRMPAQATPAAKQIDLTSPLVPLTLRGLIEPSGELVVASGEWMGNAERNQSIVGLTIHWPDKPDDVELAIAVQVRVVGWLPEVASGGFAGLRDAGLPITGLSLRVLGPGAERYELQIEAAFAGWGQLSSAPGQHVKLSGPTGTEPLTALRILLVRH